MAGTVVVEESCFQGVCRIKWSWTSTAGGAADLISARSYYGEVLALVTIPGAGGVAPTTLYDLTVVDADGYDVLQAAGADRSATVVETAVPTKASPVFGKLTLNVANAGNAKQGVAILYVRGAPL